MQDVAPGLDEPRLPYSALPRRNQSQEPVHFPRYTSHWLARRVLRRRPKKPPTHPPRQSLSSAPMLRDAVQERKEYFLVKLRFFPPRDEAKEYTIMSYKLTEMTLPAL